MWKTSVRLSALALGSQILQLALQLSLARLYGTGLEIDAYVAAVAGPNLLSALLVLTSGQMLVPFLLRHAESGAADHARARNAVLAAAACAASLFALACWALPETLLDVFAPGLAAETRALAVHYLHWTGPGLLPSTLLAYLGHTHAARERFLAPAAVGLVSSGALLAGFAVLHAEHGVGALVVLQLVTSAAGAAWLLVSELGAARGPLALRGAGLGGFLALAAPIALVAVSTRVNVAVDRWFASYLEAGSLAVLHYADRWVVIAQSVLSLPLVTVLYTRMTRTAARTGELGEAGREAFTSVLYVGLPVAAGTWIAAPDLAAVILSGRETAPGDVALLEGCLRAYAFLVALAGFGSVVFRAFYARHETLVPVLVGGVAPMFFNVVMDWLLVERFGVLGLAAVTSANAVIGLPLAAWLLARRNPGLFGEAFWLAALRSGAGCALFWPLAWACMQVLGGEDLAARALRVSAFALSSAAVYLAATRALGSQEAIRILVFAGGEER